MYKMLGLALFIVGVLLFAMGVSASESVGSELSRLFTGKPTDRTVWLMLGGLAGILLGTGGLLIPPPRLRRT